MLAIGSTWDLLDFCTVFLRNSLSLQGMSLGGKGKQVRVVLLGSS